MQKVIYYTKEICSLCEEAKALLIMFQQKYPFELEERDIYTNDAWLEKYQLLIPFVQINETTLNCEQLNMESLEHALAKHIDKV
ncbi:glutaredoxin family protein [Virgibacillus soli]|uniref:Glutaredoxin family protein n=1 Tax=Paracerasibacillus soli TaxID=480284 RepID=A0ABU5CTV8_9BACI|nr:glutaredoxin family protein [Virgibacillus soli]MDY0408863.1 glutaredoxin family protein [Virgibacillus soli]